MNAAARTLKLPPVEEDDDAMPFGLPEELRPELEALADNLCELLADNWLRRNGHPEGLAALNPGAWQDRKPYQRRKL